MTIERLKFYADTDTEKNKLFCFKINSIVDLPERLRYFLESKRFGYIRAAYYECIENNVVVENRKIDLVSFADYGETTFIKE